MSGFFYYFLFFFQGKFWGISSQQSGNTGTDYSSRLRSRTENNFTHTFLVLVAVGLGHGVYRKLYTLIEGQRAEKFENNCSRRFVAAWRWRHMKINGHR